MRMPPQKPRASISESRVEQPRHTNWRNVMSVDPNNRSDDDVVREVLKPMEEILAREDEELKKVDELIREAERKSKPILHPEP
jgi:hypothetical protein